MPKRPISKLKLTPKASVPKPVGKRPIVIKKKKPVREPTNGEIQLLLHIVKEVLAGKPEGFVSERRELPLRCLLNLQTNSLLQH